MLFKSSIHLLIYSSVLFIINSKRLKRETSNYEPKCLNQNTAVDQVFDNYNQTENSRRKRFVLFPEFINYINDWRYINRPKQISYWIANFYPNQIDTNILQQYIQHLFEQLNIFLDHDITINEALDPGVANFHYNLFDYTKCPMDDLPQATIDHVKILDQILIYPAELTRKSRYRAHGGIHLIENDQPISTVKLNMQQTFLYSTDFIYDPIIYTCIEETNQCDIDLYWVLLHETLHGFGIEHTTNAEKPIPPNAHMKSVMHFSLFRTLCHDDIRAIRMVYQLPIKRENAIYDDICRRDFPMNKLQKLMYLIERILCFSFIGFFISSLIIFILTLIYLLIRNFNKQKSPIDKKPMIKTKHSSKPRGYLWHDEIM